MGRCRKVALFPKRQNRTHRHHAHEPVACIDAVGRAESREHVDSLEIAVIDSAARSRGCCEMNRTVGGCVLLAVAFVVGTVFALSAPAQDLAASGKIETVGTIPSAGYTEGLCQTADGTVYVTGLDEQVFWKVSPSGQAQKFATPPAHIMVPLVTKDGFIASARRGVSPRTPLPVA
jgi:hypothetical protein